jgi:hypothetical protein
MFTQANQSEMSIEFPHLTSLLTEIPCSEAAAERLFSVMKWIQTKDDSRRNDLLRALMLIRRNDICGHLAVFFKAA